MRVYSEVTGLYYEEKDVVFIKNPVQTAFYIEKGLHLIDLFVGLDHKLVYIFLKKEHEKGMKLWMSNKKMVENHA